jgi:hypothetical protein
MPEISRFYGIIIKMFFSDHPPPHFHVEYGEYLASISIHTLGIIAGKLPPRIMGMVAEWASMYQGELLADWERATHLEPLERIDPLP